MPLEHSTDQPTTVEQATVTIRNVAREARNALDDGQTPGEWKEIVTNFVRGAPLPSLAVAFLVGVIVARR